MAFELKLEAAGERIVRRDYADVDEQARLVAQMRALNGGERRKDANEPWNEGWVFTPDMWELLRRTRPQLFDPDPIAKAKAWKAWARTSEANLFRVR